MAQQETAQRCLDAATGEIDAYLDWAAQPPSPPLSDEATALLVLVNLDRAAEHWRSPAYGALQQGVDAAPLLVGRDSFERHRAKLASLKGANPVGSWGIA